MKNFAVYTQDEKYLTHNLCPYFPSVETHNSDLILIFNNKQNEQSLRKNKSFSF